MNESPTIAEQLPARPSTLTLQEEADELQKRLTQGMPTDSEMRKGEPRVISRHLAWQKDNVRHIQRYLEIRAQLPTIPSIESLRLP